MSWRPRQPVFGTEAREDRRITVFQPVPDTPRGADRALPRWACGTLPELRRSGRRRSLQRHLFRLSPRKRHRPLRAIPPDDVPKCFTSFRLPIDLDDEESRAMMFETRRS